MTHVMKELVSDMRSLAPFPHVATTVLALSSREGVVPNDLIEVIRTDPGLTGKLLKLCNSAYYGFQREISSLEEAGNLLGVRTLSNLVLTSCAGRYFQDHGDQTGREQTNLWERCVTNAVAGRLIARSHGRTDPERAYTAGLLQNVGSLVLDRYYEGDQHVVEGVMAGGRSRLEAEKTVLGLNHAEIGARLSSKWMLPEVLVDTIRNHHTPEHAEIDPALCATIHLAETLAQAAVGEAEASRLAYEISDAAYQLTGIEPRELAELDAELHEEILRAREMMGM